MKEDREEIRKRRGGEKGGKENRDVQKQCTKKEQWHNIMHKFDIILCIKQQLHDDLYTKLAIKIFAKT